MGFIKYFYCGIQKNTTIGYMFGIGCLFYRNPIVAPEPYYKYNVIRFQISFLIYSIIIAIPFWRSKCT